MRAAARPEPAADLDEPALRALVVQHRVAFDMRAHQVAVAGSIARRGWTIDLYGAPSRAREEATRRVERQRVDDALRTIARRATPGQHAQVAFVLEPFSGAVVLDPRDGFGESVRLRVTVEPFTHAAPADAEDTAGALHLTSRLEALGCRRR